MTPVELRAERAKRIAEARKIHDVAETANREPTGEERGQFERLMAEADALQVRYERAEALAAAERDLGETRGRVGEGEQPGRSTSERANEDRRSSAEYRGEFETYLRTGAETRGLVADNDAAGGFLSAPTQMVDGLIKALDNVLIVRQLATKQTVSSAQSLGVPTLETDPNDATWTSEIPHTAAVTEDDAMRFGKRELHPKQLMKLVKISKKLLRLNGQAESLLMQRLEYIFGVTQEKAFFTGDGATGPLGMFVASSQGISTDRDVSTDMTSTAMTGDGLLNVKYSLKEQYMRSKALRWIFHRDGVKQIRKLKSNDNQYIWQPGLQAGQPDLLLDIPVVMSEYAPNTFTTGKYVGLLGDLSHYWIADATTLAIQRLNELYALSSQVGYLASLDCDGMPVLEEAFARVKLA